MRSPKGTVIYDVSSVAFGEEAKAWHGSVKSFLLLIGVFPGVGQILLMITYASVVVVVVVFSH